MRTVHDIIWTLLFSVLRGSYPKADLTSETQEAPIKNRFPGPTPRNVDLIVLDGVQESVFLTSVLGFLIKWINIERL